MAIFSKKSIRFVFGLLFLLMAVACTEKSVEKKSKPQVRAVVPSSPNHQIRAQCVRDICKGRDYSSTDVLRRVQEVVRQNVFQSSGDAELQNKIKESFEAQRKKSIEDVDVALRELRSGAQLSQVARRVLKLIRFKQLSSRLKGAEHLDGERQSSRVRFDREKSRESLPEISEEEFEALLLFADYFQDRLSTEKQLIDQYGGELYLKAKYPGRDLPSAYRQELITLKALIQRFRDSAEIREKVEVLRGLLDPDDHEEVMTSATFENFSEANIKKLVQEGQTLRLVFEVFSPTSDLSKVLEMADIESFFSSENLAKRITTIEQLRERLLDPTKTHERAEVFGRWCGITYELKKMSALSEDEVQRARRVSENVLDRIRRQIVPLLPSSLKPALLEELDEVHFVFPESSLHGPANYRAQFLGNLAKIGKVRGDSISSDLVVLWALTEDLEDGNAASALRDARETCGELSHAWLDLSYTKNGGIRVGWGSVRNLEVGQHAMAHEVGHKITGRILREYARDPMNPDLEKYTGHSLQCMSSMHPVTAAIELGRYYNEDSSDVIAAKVAGPDSTNFYCALSQDSLIADPLKISLNNTDETDEHSSPFFRLINIERYSGRPLSEACQAAVNQERPELLHAPLCL